ncbi:MAG: hypothetical protein IJ708_01265 [Clostridia bacterium]|nr:hypothetical protein [Clostridia bacterium]
MNKSLKRIPWMIGLIALLILSTFSALADSTGDGWTYTARAGGVTISS